MRDTLYQILTGAELHLDGRTWTIHVERMSRAQGGWFLTLALLGRPGRAVTVSMPHIDHADTRTVDRLLTRLQEWLADPASVDYEVISFVEPSLFETVREFPGVAARGDGALEKPVVLLVDDMADHLRLYELTLGDRYTVLCASTGQDGYDMACTSKPHVIVLDIALPDIDGWTICERLKANEETAATPVILITALAAPNAANRAHQTGAAALLRKPYVAEHLVRTIDASLERAPG